MWYTKKSLILKFSLKGFQNNIGYLAYIQPIRVPSELVKTSRAGGYYS
jgi:hypothetical protein